MKWFRHFSNASTSIKLNTLIDELGIKGYGQYWLLMELLNEKFDGLDASSIMVHQSELLTSLRLRYVGTLGELLGKMKGIDLFDYARDERVYSFNCPMLLELLDKDSKYNRKRDRKKIASNDSVANNRIKNKEEDKDIYTTPTPSSNFDPRKFLDAKKILPAEEPQDFRNPKGVKPDALIQRFNDTLAGKGKVKHCRGLSGSDVQEFLTTTSYAEFTKIETWDEVFQNAALSPFLLGQERSSWVVTLNWLVKHENALKVLNGAFNGGGDGDLETWALGLKLEA